MRSLKTTLFGVITVSVDVRIVNLFCFSCNLSSFISKFQHLHIRVLCNFFGQEDRRPPKSECARTPMDKVIQPLNNWGLLLFLSYS